MKAIVYTRFSPRRNADESESCEVQLAYCEQYCAQKGHEIAEIIHDPDVSGADEYRENLWQAINGLGKGWVLIVHKRDRLARNVFLSEQIIRAVDKKGATIEAVSGDVTGNGPEHVMIRQVLASISEYERKIIGIRTSHAMRYHQANGRRMGVECPYGWRDAPEPGRMVESDSERSVIAEMRGKFDEGWGYTKIANWLNANRRDMARHGRWNVKTVRKILLRETKS
jgi:site-specific DNA recombinase